jgi:hypothetical protein
MPNSTGSMAKVILVVMISSFNFAAMRLRSGCWARAAKRPRRRTAEKYDELASPHTRPGS